MVTACGHRLCSVIGGACSLAIVRSHTCRPNVTARDVAPEVLDEVRALLARIDDRDAAVQLARIVRREALDDRNLVAIARREELEFAEQLAELCTRR